MSIRRTITVPAPAKVNLALAVGAPSPAHGGMHPISSWMITIDLVDDLSLTRLEDDALSMYAILWADDAKRKSEIDWSITKDLSVRAHLALQQHTGRELPIKLKLEKRIPVGGGLGGGSSNAAAMLRGVNDLFELGLDSATLARIGASLGSDVPFLVRGGSALVEGVGDVLEHHDTVPELHMVLVLPGVACPTGPVYGAFDRLRPGATLDAARVRALVSRPLDPAAPFNDLAAPAFAVAPSLADDAEEIAALVERPVHVSGSGSTLFFLCNGRLEAELLAGAITQKLALPAIPACTVVPPRS